MGLLEQMGFTGKSFVGRAVLLSLFMPIVLIICIILGAPELEPQLKLDDIWTRKTSAYRRDREYTKANIKPGGNSLLLLVAKPRAGGNAARSDNLLPLAQRMKETLQTKLTMFGETFTYEDICTNVAYGYLFPCFRYSVLDCFEEGNYDYTEKYARSWRHLVIDEGIKKQFPGPVSNPNNRTNLDPALMDLLLSVLDFSTKTPYNWINDNAPGFVRPSLVNLTEKQVLGNVSRPCQMWDGGQQLPLVNKYLIAGGAKPDVAEVEKNYVQDPFTFIEAFQTIIPLLTPQDIPQRLTMKERPGGPVILTEDQAKDMIIEFKKILEDVFSRDWDSDGNVEFTAWSDGFESWGTTERMMNTVTFTAFRQAAFFYVAIIIVSGLFFLDLSDPYVQSRCVLVLLGAFEVVLGMTAAICITGLMGMKVSITTAFTMPFILVGILCDDLYMITLAPDFITSARSPEDLFMQALRSVGMPITVTTLVNFGVFLTMSVSSDLPAIYELGYTGMVASILLFLTLMISYTPLVYLDVLRRMSGRYECCCCRVRSRIRKPDTGSSESQVPVPDAEKVETAPKQKAPRMTHRSQTAADVRSMFKDQDKHSIMYGKAYKPLLRSWKGRWYVMAASVFIFVFGSCGIFKTRVGFDMDDFFPKGTQPSLFFTRRLSLFPSWPAAIYWGQLDYGNPNIQMKMIQQWEKLGTLPNIVPGLPSNSVWIASLAEWGLKQGPTSKCYPVWKKNVLQLKLRGAGGYCHSNVSDPSMPAECGVIDTWESQYGNGCCPVFEGLTPRELRNCIQTWTEEGNNAKVDSGIQFDDFLPNPRPRDPITISRAGGNVLYAIKLFTNADYQNLLRDSREFVDEDPDMHCWMAGIAYGYWEQYLTLVEFVLQIGALTAGAGFVLSFLFLFAELTLNGFGTPGQRLLSTFVGASLIAIVMIASMTTVLGLCSWAEVQLSAFSAMCCLMASGFAIEYAVHIVHHFLEAQGETGVERAEYAMNMLFVPTSMAFLSSAVSVVPLAFTGVSFVTRFFFFPLIFVVAVTYFLGAITLPFFMSMIGCLPRLEMNSWSSEGSLPPIPKLCAPPVKPTTVPAPLVPAKVMEIDKSAYAPSAAETEV